MLESHDVTTMTDAALEAVLEAQNTREQLRRSTKRDDGDRKRKLESQVAVLRDVMSPLRRALGQVAYLRLEPGVEDRLRSASDAVQRERRKLRKMLGTP